MSKKDEALKLALEALGWYDRETHQKAITAIREALVEQSARRQNSIEPIEFLSGFLTERLAIERGIEWTPAIHDLCNRAIEEEKLAEQPAQQECVACKRKDTLLEMSLATIEALREQPALEHEPENEPWCSMHSKPATPEMNAAVDVALGIVRKQPAQQQEPWPEEPEGHIAGGVQPSEQTQERWTERWYGSLADKGWWICCGREHIAHLGTEVSSEDVRKIVDAHNRYKPTAQQQDPVAWQDLFWKLALILKCLPSTFPEANGHVLSKAQRLTDAEFTPPPASKPWVGLTDEEMHDCWDSPLTPLGMKHVRMIEAKLREKNA